MPKKKKNQDVMDGVYLAPAEDDPTEVVPAPERKNKSAVRAQVKKDKRMTFDSYARRKGLKATHIPGLRAYCKNPNIPRTMEEWDAFFKDY